MGTNPFSDSVQNQRLASSRSGPHTSPPVTTVTGGRLAQTGEQQLQQLLGRVGTGRLRGDAVDEKSGPALIPISGAVSHPHAAVRENGLRRV